MLAHVGAADGGWATATDTLPGTGHGEGVGEALPGLGHGHRGWGKAHHARVLDALRHRGRHRRGSSDDKVGKVQAELQVVGRSLRWEIDLLLVPGKCHC